jgi:hypothetical protein
VPPAASAARRLRALCRAYVDGTPPGADPADLDPALVALARRHRVSPLLAALCAGDAGGAAAALRRDRLRSAARTTSLAALAAPLLERLDAAGVPVLVLKGAVLGATVYRDPAERPMHDVDLLARRADVPAVLDAARALGLERFADRHSLAFDLRFGAAVVLTRSPHDLHAPSIDLHWRLLDHAAVGDAADGWLAGAWARAEAAPAATGAARGLALPDLLVHVAAHLALHHACDGLLGLCDLALLLRARGAACDWDAVVAIARGAGLGAAVALALDAAHAVLGVEVPRDVRGRLAPASTRLRLARRLVVPRARRLAPLGHLEHVLPWLLAGRAGARRALARALVPPREWAALRYDASPAALAYWRHGAEAARLVARALRG